MKNSLPLKSVFWALLFATCFVISVFILSQYVLPLGFTVLIILMNAFLLGVYAIKVIKSIGSLDELQVRIHLEAVSIAFVLALLTVMIVGMLEIVNSSGIEEMNFLYVFPAFFFYYIIGFIIAKRKYR